MTGGPDGGGAVGRGVCVNPGGYVKLGSAEVDADGDGEPDTPQIDQVKRPYENFPATASAAHAL